MPSKRNSSPIDLQTEVHHATLNAKIPVIGYALMGRLAHHDQTGYELSQLMGPPRNFNWEAGHSQIYPVLKSLTEAGYVVYTSVQQDGKPNKKVYSLTGKGRDALYDWVAQAPTPVPTRNEFNLKVFSLWMLPPDQAIEVLEQQVMLVESEIEAITAHLQDAERRYGVTFPVRADSKIFGLYSSVMYTRESRNFALQWYRWMIEELRKILVS